MEMVMAMSEPTSDDDDEQRWLARVKELEWRADLARLALSGDIAVLSERLAQRRGACGDPQLSFSEDELARLQWLAEGNCGLRELGDAVPKLIAEVRRLRLFSTEQFVAPG